MIISSIFEITLAMLVSMLACLHGITRSRMTSQELINSLVIGLTSGLVAWLIYSVVKAKFEAGLWLLVLLSLLLAWREQTTQSSGGYRYWVLPKISICPSCSKAIPCDTLLIKPVKVNFFWYELTRQRLHCPHCDSKLTFDCHARIWLLIFCAPLLLVGLFELVVSDTSKNVLLLLLTLCVAFIGVIVFKRQTKYIKPD